MTPNGNIFIRSASDSAIKDGGYAIFENVITDSIVGPGVLVQVKNGAGGTLNIRKESKKGDVISKCDLPSASDASKWIDVRCSNMPELKGVQDFYLTAEGLGGETLLGNIKFDKGVDTSRTVIRQMDGRASFETHRSNIAFDRENGLVRLASEAKWTLLDANGVAVKHGYGREFRMFGLPHGVYFVHAAKQMLPIRY